MRLGDAPESDNFEDRTGQSAAEDSAWRRGRYCARLPAALVASRFGIVGILILRSAIAR